MGLTVRGVFDQMAQFNLAAPDAVRALQARWPASSPNPDDASQLLHWLVAEGALTEYQSGVLTRGHGPQLALGPYTILDRTGRGSLSGVFKARHRTGHVVALKVMPPSKARDPKALARFKREARLASRLCHPNVARVFHAGFEAGLHFLVMEMVDGEPLDEYLKRKAPLLPAEAASIGHQLLQALDHLHERCIVHRDIKPANLVLAPGGLLRLLDIGMGRDAFGEDAGTELTNEDELLGSPEYMAPEQARDPRSADIRADIYSAGCIIYHALAGQPPFNDSNRVRVLMKHANEAPRPLRDLNRAVPEPLAAAVAQMLAKSPDARPANPADAAASLKMFVRSTPSAPPPNTTKLSAYQQWLNALPQPDADEEDVPAPPPRPAPPPARPAPLDEPRPAPRPPPAPAPPRARRRREEEVDEVEEVEAPARPSGDWTMITLIVIGSLILVALVVLIIILLTRK